MPAVLLRENLTAPAEVRLYAVRKKNRLIEYVYARNRGRNTENTKLNRINELARLAKERELTAEELAERDALRKEYIAEWRRGAEQVLENTWIVTPDGTKVKLQKKK